jgi:single-stranded DNA-binding protein
MKVCVEGRIKLDEFEGQDGKSRAKMAITATRVVFLDKRDNTRESSNPPDDDDDMPWN